MQLPLQPQTRKLPRAMNFKLSITVAVIRSMATSRSFTRGKDCYRVGAVSELARGGSTLTAEVEGSDYDPYQVTIHLAEESVSNVACTCPYDWGGVDKYIMVVLLDKHKRKYSLVPRLRQLQ